MNKKIKVIELLNKIANKENLPESIEFRKIQYDLVQYDLGGHGDYINYGYCDENNNDRWLIDDEWEMAQCLNDYVEILEDNTEEIEELKYDVVDENGRGWYKLDTIADKVTELIKSVNAIRKDIKNG